ncbi:hypothetical protein GCM10010156_58150 [Planobispora rosea]|uniref:Uncharacterized protein n=1 Tax=Planobispora rosea TaxID=35762 RepID=A0A8J3SC91_PLARO|nr:hypothetical protein GCM10010156_58150 [Planobispora rosea]GIH87118.1 hypothetical protein Pro02_55260 [Planobispora rosea]
MSGGPIGEVARLLRRPGGQVDHHPARQRRAHRLQGLPYRVVVADADDHHLPGLDRGADRGGTHRAPADEVVSPAGGAVPDGRRVTAREERAGQGGPHHAQAEDGDR